MANFIEITEDNFEAEVTNSDVPVILDLWATWCGPCVALGGALEKIAPQYEGRVKVCKINVDEQQALAQAFKVRSIPMVVTVSNGEVVDVTVGFRGESQVTQIFEKAVG